MPRSTGSGSALAVRASALSALASVAAIVLAAPALHAQTLDERRARADALFNEGQQLLSANQIPAACAKLEESQRQDPKLGRLLNVAYCHERQGRIATAWAEYNQAAAVALQGRQTERETFARGRASELAAKLSFIRLDMQQGAEIGTILVDGRPVPRDQWSIPFPIDPGSHNLSFEAPAHKSQTQTVTVEDAQTVRVIVTPLEPAPADAAPAPAPAPPPAALLTPTPAPTPASEPAPEGRPPASHTLRTIGWIVGGVGVVGIGVGTGFALHSLSQKSDADKLCPAKLCTPKGTSLISDATTSANIATAGFAVGLVGLAAGAWLVIQPFRSSPKTAASALAVQARLSPYVGPDRTGVALEGTW
jgi:hypothetical protein